MREPLETFAGLLDRSIEEMSRLAADARTFDTARIGAIADVWDNNLFPLMRAARAVRWRHAARARDGLRRMADLGAARRQLLVSLDPALETELPAVAEEPSAHQTFDGRVQPRSQPVTTETAVGLAVDYDLAESGVRFLDVRPAGAGLGVRLELAAPRRFVPSVGRVVPDGSRRPWPPAPLIFTFVGVSDLRFDSADQVGVRIDRTDSGVVVAIGRGGGLRCESGSVSPDDPMWHESAAGVAAAAGLAASPAGRRDRAKPVRGPSLTGEEVGAARALHLLMILIRLVDYHPVLASGVPVREICRVTAGAGSAILAAAARRPRARRAAFAELSQRWRAALADVEPNSIPPGPATLRYASFRAPYDDDDSRRNGSAVLVAAVPSDDPAAPWRLASEQIARPARFRIASSAFAAAADIERGAGVLTAGEVLSVES